MPAKVVQETLGHSTITLALDTSSGGAGGARTHDLTDYESPGDDDAE
jgi:hypothetical protein